MRAVRYQQYGPPEVLQLIDLPEPGPGPDQVTVTVEAVGVNAIDAVFRRGGSWTWPLPGTLTGDVVGRISNLGENVAGFAIGDRVAGLADDAFCDQVRLDAQWLAGPGRSRGRRRDGAADGAAAGHPAAPHWAAGSR